ncbi:hypothetical protein F4775DRAFT_594815 [Biscogniauxia sp. FL1348]|nr:hypothetical protein F4775DRAFT_594815 [Biscogniauxia sp. FL1348]
MALEPAGPSENFVYILTTSISDSTLWISRMERHHITTNFLDSSSIYHQRQASLSSRGNICWLFNAADLTTGSVDRLTARPEYADPVDILPDDQWTVAMDIRSSDRQMFITASRNSSPFSQMINGAGSGVSGNGDINDPEWNGRADPNRAPKVPPKVKPVPDVVSWGTSYVPGSAVIGHPRRLLNILNGYENYTRSNPSPTLETGDWFSDPTQTVETHATKKTSPNGFHVYVDCLRTSS